MTSWNEATLKRRQRWFPWLALAAAVTMAAGYIVLDLELLAAPLAVGIPFAILVALTLATLGTSVAPRNAKVFLVAAVVGVIVLRTLIGALSTLFASGLIVTVIGAVLSVSPLVVLAAYYFRRLR
ncbi:hypothetical protein [Microbacterium sp. WHRI 7836]|uniref:hypothetical protein n=1 Tax=Microbacterium TaxID=33882 RepID=UPI0032ECA6C6